MRKYSAIVVAVILAPLLFSAAFITVTGLTATPVRSEFAVVLGNKVNPDGRPALRLRARLDEALQLYRSGEVKRVIVSGGIEEGGISEPEAMAGYLVEHGVPAGVISEDPKGRTTHQTAVALAGMLPRDTSVIAVTQWFHVARSELAMRQCGFTSVTGSAPRYFDARDIYSLARESVGLPFYYAFRRAC
ncbi:YdcF family protein [Acetobacter sp. DsW_063]|uniref:YdcF family protein n=1 Tax=Acetobacter sp. DsW_063 TaxID=1514894 RepID=UPI000A367BD4|nr:YdcF family protein [Acetobacter sp. DsW_063]OUJ17125.1 hypothetical protein HK28_00015 [Acetobacter sp. DsW_063]